jgi:pimeloyl-ACP methyl ester carboxylesterase
MNHMQKLLLLHGALGCAADLAPLQQALAGRFDTLALDFSGHGAKAGGALNMDAFIQDVAAAADGPAHLFGYSMGGYVALCFAALYPGRVEKIYTLGTKLDWSPETGRGEAARLHPEKIAEKVPHFAALLAQRHGAAHWAGVVRQTAVLLEDLGRASRLDEVAFGRIGAEVLIARGELDKMVSEAECLAAVAHIPQATYLLLPGQPHPLEQCDHRLLADSLRQFFSRAV